MKHARPLLLAASALFLLISACSQPADIQTPSLEPQFGTAGDDRGENLAVSTRGIYSTGIWDEKPVVFKFTRDGRLPWLRELTAKPGDDGVRVYDVASTSSGQAYVFYASSYEETTPNGEHTFTYSTYYLRKYAPEGKVLWERKLTEPSDGFNLADNNLGVDSSNNVVVALLNGELRKYSASGTLLWSRNTATDIRDLEVAPNDFIMLTAQTPSDTDDDDRLMRYSSSGKLIWTKAVPFYAMKLAVGRENEVYVAGFNFFEPGEIDSEAQLARYNASGTKLWQRRVQTDPRSFRPRALTADKNGNAYVGIDEGLASEVQKYLPNGSRAWSYGISTPKGGGLYDLAVLSSSEIYVTGYTNGTVNGVNHGSNDGYLLRLDGQGKKVWSR